MRAIYVTPHHQFPTTVGMAPGRRMELLELARKHHIAVIEDDYEFHYQGRPILPLASAGAAGVVIYVGTLSKILAPTALAERIAALRAVSDRQGDQAVECAVTDLLEDAEVQRHARRMRSVYLGRRDRLAAALQSRLGNALTTKLSAGGMALWVRAENGIDVLMPGSNEGSRWVWRSPPREGSRSTDARARACDWGSLRSTKTRSTRLCEEWRTVSPRLAHRDCGGSGRASARNPCAMSEPGGPDLFRSFFRRVGRLWRDAEASLPRGRPYNSTQLCYLWEIAVTVHPNQDA